MKNTLQSLNVHTAVIPGGCTSKLQTLDVCINHPFKVYLEEDFDLFMEDSSKHTFTKAGNMRAPSKMQLCDMVVNSWNRISNDIVEKSFLSCGQNPYTQVEMISCFKDGRSCAVGRPKLEDLMSLGGTYALI